MIKIDSDLLQVIADIAVNAGDIILNVYDRSEPVSSHLKKDNTPITEADLFAHDYIINKLKDISPEIPLISEESELPDYSVRQHWSCYWLIDPLDGTKEFLARNGEFTVNIALIVEGVSVLGVVYAPVLRRLYQGINHKAGHDFAERIDVASDSSATSNRYCLNTQALDQQVLKHNAIRLVSSRHHGLEESEDLHREIEKQLCPVVNQAMGSSLKFCQIAEGEADMYLRLGPTSEWDTAAAQAIVEAAGGSVLDAQLQPLRYNTKSSILNPAFFVAGDKPHSAKSAVRTLLNIVSRFLRNKR